MNIGTTNPFFYDPKSLSRWKKGPLAPYLDDFSVSLIDQGYTLSTGKTYVRSVGYFSRWLESKNIDIKTLNQRQIETFVQSSRHHLNILISKSPLIKIYEYLIDLGVVKKVVLDDKSEITIIIAQYQDYLRNERGLAESTLKHRKKYINNFFKKK